MINEDTYVKFITRYKLTQEQYLLLHLVYKGRSDLIELYKSTFPTDDGRMISAYQINDLFKKGFLKQGSAPGKYVLGDNFLDMFVDIHTATDEIYNLYPAFVYSDGVDIPLTSMDRNVFAEIYQKAINGDRKEHEEVLKDIQYGIDHDLIRIGINKFLTSHYWKVLRQRRVPDAHTAPSVTTLTNEDLENEF